MAAGVSIRQLEVRYDQVVAVDGLDLDVSPGEIVAVLGRSGSGKSSLLRAIAGLVDPSAGSVTVDDVEVTTVKSHKRPHGLMLSAANLFPRYDVSGNIEYGLGKLPRRQRQRRVGELLDRFGLAGVANAKIEDLSEGQSQRVAVARTLAPRPQVLLLDEPLGGVEGDDRADLVNEITRYVRDESASALWVTHMVEEAFSFADRVVILDRGHVVQLGEPEQVRFLPRNRLVAEYLGFGPFLEAESDGQVATTALGAIPARGLTGSVLVGLSSEGLRLDPAGISVRVRSVRARPGFVEISVRLPDGQAAVIRTVRAVDDPDVAVALDAAGCVIVPSPSAS